MFTYHPDACRDEYEEEPAAGCAACRATTFVLTSVVTERNHRSYHTVIADDGSLVFEAGNYAASVYGDTLDEHSEMVACARCGEPFDGDWAWS